jgi:hypothetical protein
MAGGREPVNRAETLIRPWRRVDPTPVRGCLIAAWSGGREPAGRDWPGRGSVRALTDGVYAWLTFSA